MKTLLIIISLVFAFSIQAQKSDLLFSAGTTINYRNLVFEDENNGGVLNKVEDAQQLKFSAGIDFRKWLSTRTSLAFGLEYMNAGYSSPNAYFTFPNEHNGNGGFIQKNDEKIINNIHALAVPVLLHQRLRVGDFSIFIKLGFVPTYILTEERISESTLASTGEFYRYELEGNKHEEFQLGARGGLHLEYMIAEKLSISLSPDFTYFLTANGTDEAREHLYNTGIRLGIVKEL